MIAYFVRHPTAANLLMLTIVLLGVLGLASLQREVFPDFASEFINIRVVYKGASAEEVEETICRRIEDKLKGIEGIAEVTSVARESLSLLTVEVIDGYEVAAVLRDVENAVEQIDNFPADVEDPIVYEFTRVDPVCTVTVWADGMSEKDLVALSDSIESELLALDGVSLVRPSGYSEHQIRVELDEASLWSYGLTVGDVAAQIAAQSVDLPTGSIETSHREIKIRMVDQRRRAEEFGELIVKFTPEGARIPLRAVASLRDTFEEDWSTATFEGRRCVHLEVQKTGDEDTIRVAEIVERYVERKQRELPPGARLTRWGDWSFYVKDRLGMLVRNGVIGFVLVFFTLWLMLNLRISIWVAAGIPISFLGTLFVLEMSGNSLNMITMFSLILALGIIVDDAIVIGENVFAHYARGRDPVRAAVEGTKEVALGVAASMMTTVAVFLPLLLMRGEIGKVMRVMPIGVIAALTVSLVEAFLILPNHLRHSMVKIPERPPRLREAINRVVERLTHHVYGPVLWWSARRPLVTVALAVALFVLSVGMLLGGRLKFQLFPELDGDFLTAQIEMPDGTDARRTWEVIHRIEAALEKVEAELGPRQPDGQKLIRHVAASCGSIRDLGDKPLPPETGSHLAQVIVELLGADRRSVRCDDVLAVWRREVGDVADVLDLTLEQMQVTPGGKAVDIQLRGRDLRALQAASHALQEKLRTYPGVRNARDNLRPGKEEVLVRLKPEALPLGVTSAALARQLREAFFGAVAQEFQRGRDNVEVRVRFAPEDRRSPADLDDFKVRTADGRMAPLHEVAVVQSVRGFSQIVRIDGERTVNVTADVDTAKGNAADILRDLESRYLPEFLERHDAVELDLEGQRKETQETGLSVLVGFLVGLCIIFLVLSFVFQSYVEPLIVMAAIPFALVGAVGGHMLMRIDWTMPSTIGFVSLSGIVVNDSIVLVDFIKRRLREGSGILDAVYLAGVQRLRPVFLTTATTVAGLLPLVLETSLQAQFLVPMGVSISFGLLFASFLVLVLVPSVYGLLAWAGWSQRIESD